MIRSYCIIVIEKIGVIITNQDPPDQSLTQPIRPWTVKLLAALPALPGAYLIINGVIALFVESYEEMPLGWFLEFLSFFLIVLGLLLLSIGFVLWRGSKSAWFAAVAIAVFMLFSSITAFDIVGLALSTVFIALALVPTTRAFFDVKRKR
jgi:lysylphosphatidylglycerol synthetase-like protein (DUF2156 family)